MLVAIRAARTTLDKRLLPLNSETEPERIYVWPRLVNPFDVEDLRAELRGAPPARIKECLSNREIAYVAVSEDREVQVYRDLFALSDMFYASRPDEFLLSETLKDFYHLGIKPAAVDQYQRIGFVPGNDTIIAGASKVLPGERITIDVASNAAKSLRKPMQDAVGPPPRWSPDTFQEQFESLMFRNLDGARGVLLSGGFDSALLTYLVSRTEGGCVAFTGYTKHKVNQLEKQRAMKTGSLFCKDHQLLDLNASGFEQIHLRAFAHMQEPFADNSILGECLLAEHARRLGIDVLVEGLAADAFWGNLPKVRRYALARRLSRHACVRKTVPFLALLHPKFRVFAMSNKQLMKRYGGAGNYTEQEFQKAFCDGNEKFLSTGHTALHMAIYLLEDCVPLVLPKIRMACSYAGCAIVTPFMEPDMLKLALSVPPQVKYQRDKAALKNVYEVALGREKYRDKHAGFCVPMAEWILDKHKDLLYTGRFYEGAEIGKLVNDFATRPSLPLDRKIWRVFVLNLWYETNKDSLSQAGR